MARDTTTDFYTVAQAADVLGVSVSTVWRWIDSHRLPAFRLGPKAIRIRKQDLEGALRPVAARTQPVQMTDVIYTDIQAARRPLTRAEVTRGVAALDAAARFARTLRARRRGRLFQDSAALIRAEREKRSRRL